MKITAITHYKHGELFAILTRLGWTQAELARRAGLSPCLVGEIINLRKRPLQKHADAIQRAFGDAGEYLDVLEQWPETFGGMSRSSERAETVDVPMERLIGCREALMLPAPEQALRTDLSNAMGECLDTLTEREKRVIEARFYENRTLDNVANELRFKKGGGERVRQIESRALRKLRHPSRIRKLEVFAGAFSA